MDPLIRRQLERVFKGVANHRRIEILQLLQAEPRLTLWQIRERARLGRQTACEHVRRLALARLVHKRYRGREVEHTLAPLGRKILDQLPLFLTA
jgi:predicted transcriptional regulator